jgi:1-acyl-sn-glycerol-3-phosphate acyltransferase
VPLPQTSAPPARRHPLLRLFDVVDPRDLARVLNPLEVALVLRQLASGATRDPGGADPGERDPDFVEAFVDTTRFVAERYFRYRLEGVEHLPASGPALIVGNHSGGLVPLDSLFPFVTVRERFGRERCLYALGHDVLYDVPLFRQYAGRLGVLRAGHEGGRRALQAGHLLLVYPGSDYDSFRPFSERNRVVLAGRTGFVKLALRSQVPVIPLASVGMHETLIVLTRGEVLGRRLGMHRLLRTDVLPVALGLPWGLFVPLLPQIPLPAQVSMAFLPPLGWDLPPAAADDPAVVRRCYLEVEQALQSGLDRLSRGRVPWLG